MAVATETEEVAATQKVLVEAFRKLDLKNSGALDRETFLCVLRALFPAWPDGDVEVMLAASGASFWPSGNPYGQPGETALVEYSSFSSWLFAKIEAPPAVPAPSGGAVAAQAAAAPAAAAAPVGGGDP